MIGRSLHSRILTAGVAATLLLTSAAGALGAHRCTHHDGRASGHSAMEHAPADHDAGHDDDRPLCTCLGTCQGSATVAAPGADAPTWAPPTPVSDGGLLATPAVRPSHAPYFLPFANAPPAA